jgi:2-polyprenyl-3-methyl-5-hydroxy-6-metoxy-1,4-benzoquinol methylase
MDGDLSNGWEAVAGQLIAGRSTIGVSIVKEWAAALPPGGHIVDVGCGSGEPMSAALVGMGFEVTGIDASPTLAEAYRRRFPDALVACEAAERSAFFGRQFDGAIAIGLLYLLAETAQRELIARVAAALKPRGRFLFTAPQQICSRDDLLTGRLSRSLGEAEYRWALEGAGMELIATRVDEGENHYYDAIKLG